MLVDIDKLFNGINDAIKFVDDYGSIILETKRKVAEGKGFKILNPKQIFQRLPITLAQVEAGNTSENFLNKIR